MLWKNSKPKLVSGFQHVQESKRGLEVSSQARLELLTNLASPVPNSFGPLPVPMLVTALAYSTRLSSSCLAATTSGRVGPTNSISVSAEALFSIQFVVLIVIARHWLLSSYLSCLKEFATPAESLNGSTKGKPRANACQTPEFQKSR